MQFKVPKFIEVENKIFGPLTFKQFIYLGGGVGSIYIVFRILPSVIALPLAVIIGIFAFMLAFTKREKYGKQFVEIVEAAFKYTTRPRLYTWKRTPKEHGGEERGDGIIDNFSESDALFSIPKVTTGKLSDKLHNLEMENGTHALSEEQNIPDSSNKK